MIYDIAAWAVIVAFVLFVVFPLLFGGDGSDGYFSGVFIGSALTALIVVAAGVTLSIMWALSHLFGG